MAALFIPVQSIWFETRQSLFRELQSAKATNASDFAEYIFDFYLQSLINLMYESSVLIYGEERREKLQKRFYGHIKKIKISTKAL